MQFENDDDGNMWPEILPPVITAPTDLLAGVLVTLGLVITLGGYVSGYGAQVSTDYEIVDTSNGSVAWSSTANTTALLTITVPALTLSTGKTYRLRVRCRSALYISEWSKPITFST